MPSLLRHVNKGCKSPRVSPWLYCTILTLLGQHFTLGPASEYLLTRSLCVRHVSNSPEPQQWPRAQTSETALAFCMPRKREKQQQQKNTHWTALVLTVVIDGVGNQRRKSYRVVAVLVGEESLEAEADDVEIVLIDVVQLLFRH